MSNYKKPYLSFAQQVAQLGARGLTIPNSSLAEKTVERFGYYRLSGYWYPYRRPGAALGAPRLDDFVPGVSLDDVVALYDFDKQLRGLTLNAFEQIEVALRVDIAYCLGKYDCFAHENVNLLDKHFLAPRVNGRSPYDDWKDKLDSYIAKSKEEFVKHFQAKYGLPFPVWVVIELWDFGLMSRFYSGTQKRFQAQIANKYGVRNAAMFGSWLRSMNYIRNVCAHHARFWNRNIIDQPQLPTVGSIPLLSHVSTSPHMNQRLYAVLALAQFLLRQIDPQLSFAKTLTHVLATFPGKPPLSLKDAGFPTNWQAEALWR